MLLLLKSKGHRGSVFTNNLLPCGTKMAPSEVLFRKIISVVSPAYPQINVSYYGEGVYQARSANQNNFRQFCIRTKKFESSFFPYCIKEWNNISEEIRKIESTIRFKTNILSFIRPKEKSFFKILDTNRIKLLSRLRFHFSHLMNINSDKTLELP